MPQDHPRKNEMTRPGAGRKWVGALYEIADVASLATLCGVVLLTFLLRFAGVDGTSMEPTLAGGQRLAVTAVLTRPARGDIVVLSPRNGHHKPLVKRVIAVAGEEIDLADGRVLIDGVPIDEPYLPGGVMTYPAHGSPGDLAYPARVPAGHVFVMGDNRGGSSDSRSGMVGFVRADDIVGKVILRVKPFFASKPFRFTFRVK
ncbi:MAG: signal peptidase I [Oscillospiraceae bacterium]|jgi:signal peptidase I|nr:signal peptidase I [Oscillospiraceae bacterium]